MWLSSFLEKDKVLRTKREIRWRRVQLKRSIKFVFPLSLLTDTMPRTRNYSLICRPKVCIADRAEVDIPQVVTAITHVLPNVSDRLHAHLRFLEFLCLEPTKSTVYCLCY